MDAIRWLAELGRTDVDVAGGKGANLGELLRGGFVVPDGFVVTTAAYDAFVAQAELSTAIADVVAAVTGGRPGEAAAFRVAAAFGAADLDPDLARAIRDAYTQLGGGPVAVRSSATAEDLAEASFAGQQDTYLNVVGADEVVAAVRDCWASLWTDRAIWYRAQHDVGETSLAVVVQKLVPADSAGVMFTANPANGRTEETVITAAWGLGEAVVSGLVDTDTIVVDAEAGRVLSSVVADKAVRIDPAAYRTERTPTGAEGHAAVLTDADAIRLAELGARIARHFGAPQDIEWARAGGEFAIVQSRPITALPDRIGEVPADWPVPRQGLYFRASITEQLPDPLTPLFADLMATAVPAGLNRMLSEFMPGRTFDIGFPTINGYGFYRYTSGDRAMMLRATPGLIRMLTADHGSFVEDRWRRRLAGYRAEVDAENAVEMRSVPAADILPAVARLTDAVAYYYTAVQTIIPLASMAELTWTGVYNTLLKRADGPAAETFLLGFDSEPIRAERSLYDLARWAREQPGLAVALDDPAVDALADVPPDGVGTAVGEQWRQRFAVHLADHGHTLYNLDFVNPVPADDPGPVLRALRFDLAEDAPNPYARQAEAAAVRNNASAALLSRLRGRREQQVRRLLEWAQHTGPLREDALAAMGLYLPPARRLLRELGRRLVSAGGLAEPMDVCWLTLAEARAAASVLDGDAELPPDLRERVAARQARARGQRLATPPQYLPRNRVMTSMEWMFPAREGGARGGVLTGTASSGGVVTGRARVLAGPADFAAFQPGEVLVASITTPAYTPLFAMAAGVVTDIGGVLSHGSIVAREYGIPAVLGTGSGTRLIRTGDEITLDGAAGTVRLPVTDDQPSVVAEEPSPTVQPRTWLLIGGAVALVVAVAVRVRRRRQR